ncbi:ESX-1 secretion-associated protein EspI [Mycobacteroides abscessus subsp. massiliense]|nr:MinD/ParA family protein [Mycobacteroides abscessus]SKF87844.1 ESX-1 secretion-associated protein EspI [Mycobacteroides abscessus subsp. massiliense]SKG41830.1 ESX-1 secretion-associated protein EspI [Mycobacteroides abscessus subsp. massiliense]SKH79068.1 ESX-1 secretion-associated protein EspI [Mycobacteroides abscessus subsp. massiliense]SKI44732.1 ESX-1 secretion-associated protein EspI [Mycobacteroides abscessus subsp. massiliense]
MNDPNDPPSERPDPTTPWREPIPDGLGQEQLNPPFGRWPQGGNNAAHPNFGAPPNSSAPLPPPKAHKLSRRFRSQQTPLAPSWDPEPLSMYGAPHHPHDMRTATNDPSSGATFTQPPAPGSMPPPVVPTEMRPRSELGPQQPYYSRPEPLAENGGVPPSVPPFLPPALPPAPGPLVHEAAQHPGVQQPPSAEGRQAWLENGRVPDSRAYTDGRSPYGSPSTHRVEGGEPSAQPPMQPPHSYHGTHEHVNTPFTSAQAMPPPQQLDFQRPMLPSVDQLGLIRSAKPLPNRGWRKVVHRLSGGAVNPGESSAEATRRALIDRINAPVRGDYRIAVLSLKGGVGKTTTTFSLGATFASLRGDRVIAVDANPDFGTLAQRGPDETRSTTRDLLSDSNINRYSDVRRHTSQSASRLEILASERDPASSELFSEDDYRAVMRILQRFYNIIITDCGTGLMHSAMAGVLDEANALIVVSSPAIDGARSALATLDWLDHHGYSHLAHQAVVVISSSRPGASSVDLEQLRRHFLTRARMVHTVPFDSHLAEGLEISLDLMNRKTRFAFMELAASVADGFTQATRDRRLT